ncbi:MAG: hypothetical protein K5776_05880 [Lachnospiraceae bacterium]|nr:hypothetical protein [Lachnospiraceae bacterium]
MEKSNENVAPVRLEMLVTIIPRKKEDYYLDLLQSFDVNIQTGVLAEGTAEATMLEVLGMSDSEKAVIFSIVREDRLEEIEEVLEKKFYTIKGGKGVAVSIPLSSVFGVTSYGFMINEMPGRNTN